MEIQVGKTSGFCYGVKNAVDKTNDILEKEKNKTIYCLGELVHNKTIINELKEKGLKFINNIEQADSMTIIRAHGIAKEVYEKAKKRNIDLIDLTCPSVLKIHKIAQEYASKDYYIFLVGKKEHPEIIGTYSFCGKNSYIISGIEDVENAIENLENSKLNKVLIIVQTTYSTKVFNEIVEEIKERIAKDILIEVKNTICRATELRQEETKELSKKVDLMIIVGGKNSSNTNKLYDLAQKNCKNAIFVESKEDLDKEKVVQFDKIGIMAGASTPQKNIDEIIEILNK